MANDRSYQNGSTRRAFLKRMAAASAAAAAAKIPAWGAESDRTAASAIMPRTEKIPVTVRLNGRATPIEVEPRNVLLDVLREQLHLPGTKKGCDHGQCGSCTVLVNGRRIKSCLTFAVMHDGDEITTIEGLAHGENLHPIQAAFIEHDAFQCGACTCGQIMSAVGLLNEPVGNDDASVRDAMSGNICRCGAYKGILSAIQSVRNNMNAPAT